MSGTGHRVTHYATILLERLLKGIRPICQDLNNGQDLLTDG